MNKDLDIIDSNLLWENYNRMIIFLHKKDKNKNLINLLNHVKTDVTQNYIGNVLIFGCLRQNIELMCGMLYLGANIEHRNKHGDTSLMIAAKRGHLVVVQVLLKNGCNINAYNDKNMESALTYACLYKGNVKMVQLLLESGADMEHKDIKKLTPLMKVSIYGHVEIANVLLNSGAKTNKPNDSEKSALILAIINGNTELVNLLLDRGANKEEADHSGYTPLMHAAQMKHKEIMELLLRKGANINATHEKHHATALTLVCDIGSLEIADCLLKAGIDIDKGFYTPLMAAAANGYVELVRYLLESGAKVDIQTNMGYTALTYACYKNHVDNVKLLLQFGADIEHRTEEGKTPLMVACYKGHLNIVQLLISKGANVNPPLVFNDDTSIVSYSSTIEIL